MKRNLSSKLLVIASVLCLAGPAFGDALANWHWRNPLPNGNPQPGIPTLKSVIFTNGIFVAVGDSGVASVSSDAINWTESATATTSTLNSVVYGNGLFIAVGEGGAVETSTDATNWVLRTSGTTASLSAVACANGRYVATGDSVVITSPDAVNWSSAVSGLSGATSLAGGSAGFVAIQGQGTNQVHLSADGLTWKSQTFGVPLSGGLTWTPQLYLGIVAYVNGQYLIGGTVNATSASTVGYIFTSVDGSHWVTNAAGGDGIYGFGYRFFMSGNGVLIAGATTIGNPEACLQFSTDGVNWTQDWDLPDSYVQGTSGAYGNGDYVIVAPAVLPVDYPYMGTQPFIFTSKDGLNWTNQYRLPPPPVGPTTLLTSIAYNNGIYVAAASDSIVRSSNGLAYAAVSNSPALSSLTTLGAGFVGVGQSGAIYSSPDGTSWTQHNSATTSSLHGITSGNGLLVAVGDNGAIQTSTTGTIWTSRTSGTSLPLYGAACSGDQFVTVGQLGTVLTSPDGITWTGQDSGQLTNLMSITCGPAGFAAVGLGGTILTSPDGSNWTKQNSGTVSSLESITYGDGYYLTSGDDAVVLTSADGVNWTPRNVGATGGQNLYGCAFLNGRFDVVGSLGTILESDPLPPRIDLQIHAGGNWLTAFVQAGTSFRIQSCTNLLAPNWTDIATFNNVSGITLWTNSTFGLDQDYFRAVSP